MVSARSDDELQVTFQVVTRPLRGLRGAREAPSARSTTPPSS